MDYEKTAIKYIDRQERFYNRKLHNITRFLLKDFANYLAKEIAKEPVQTSITPTLPRIAGKKFERGTSRKVQVALITEDVGHLTGGRYYCWFIASALVELGYEVTVYTNRKPVFEDYFSKYAQPNIQVVCEKPRELETLDIEADIYLGSPISGNVAAAQLGKKYGRPAYALIFDPFPMMDKFLGKHNYPNWLPLIAALRSTKINIISLCDSTSEYIYDWLNKRKDQVLPIYPCINSKDFDPTPQQREDYVVFISRLVKHKNFDHVVRACKHLGIRLKVIASVDGIGAERLVKDMGMKNQVDFLFKISDAEKFEVIKKARAVVNASIFEGFGIWFIEAITCGTPTVCYDYPTIREIAKKHDVKNVYLARWNEPASLEKELKRAYDDQFYTPQSQDFFFDAMVKRTAQVFGQEPKIGIITIALNEDQFIKASLRAVIKHPNVAKVAVVEGAVNLFSHASSHLGLSLDGTPEAVYSVMQEKNGHKIIYERYGWANDKSELRNRALTLLGQGITHVLVVDADEVWKQADLDKLVSTIKANPTTGVFLFPFYHFWKKKDLIATGGQWDSQLFRFFRFADKTLHWRRHELPVVNYANKFINVLEGQMEIPDIHVYHYGYMKKGDNVRAKLEYYRKRDGANLNVVDTWTGWKQGDPTQPTHGGGGVAKFSGVHPKEVVEYL